MHFTRTKLIDRRQRACLQSILPMQGESKKWKWEDLFYLQFSVSWFRLWMSSYFSPLSLPAAHHCISTNSRHSQYQPNIIFHFFLLFTAYSYPHSVFVPICHPYLYHDILYSSESLVSFKVFEDILWKANPFFIKSHKLCWNWRIFVDIVDKEEKT